jgi:hypothetical protein
MLRGEDARRRVLREVGRWLDPTAPSVVRGETPIGWDRATWQVAGDVVFTQGIAGWLHRSLAGTALESRMPAPLRDRLAEEHARTAARAERVHRDLARILDAAASAGVVVMPLKGSLLTTLRYLDPATRPMADIDLLIREPDRKPMLDAMLALGYRQADGFRSPGRDELLDPGGSAVVSWTSEDPDNTCPVELLRRVDKRPWAGRIAYDLTELLWAEAEPTTILGRPAWRPSDRSLLIHLAAHATMNLIAGTGRLIQLADLAVVAPRVASLGDVPVPRLVHTALVLSGRLMPTVVPADHAAGLAAQVPRGLRHWSASVPIDTRAGLADGTPTAQRSARSRVWARWRPVPWRLWAGYPDGSLARAYVRHARAIAKQRRYRRRVAARLAAETGGPSG